jgi:hypothetical protein
MPLTPRWMHALSDRLIDHMFSRFPFSLRKGRVPGRGNASAGRGGVRHSAVQVCRAGSEGQAGTGNGTGTGVCGKAEKREWGWVGFGGDLRWRINEVRDKEGRGRLKVEGFRSSAFFL